MYDPPSSGTKEVVVKARGRAISRAVDVVEVLRRRFVSDLKIKDVKIATDTIETSGEGPVNVSTIEIIVE